MVFHCCIIGKGNAEEPVILTPYNLPPSMCLKDPVMFFIVIIPGLWCPKQRLDVYMQLLIAELISLWDDGVLMYDVSRKQNFVMRTAVIWTISDFPAYSMLSGMNQFICVTVPFFAYGFLFMLF